MQVILTHKLYSKKGSATARVHFMKVIAHDGSISDISFKEEEGRKAFWHTASHILAQAVKRLYPETKLTIGPAIKEGFYYDFDRETPFTAEDFDAIEAEMKKIVKENLPLKRTTLSREEALNKIKSLDEPYKEVFTLRVFGELPFEKIAQLFGKSPGWARVVFYRAKTQIQDYMEELNDEQNQL